MKSHIMGNGLTTPTNRVIREEVEKQMCIERTYQTINVTKALLVAFAANHGYGKMRLENLFVEIIETVSELYEKYADCWAEKVDQILAAKGFVLDEDAIFNGYRRSQMPDAEPVKLKMTPEQEAYVRESLKGVLSDAELHERRKMWRRAGR